MIPSQHFWNGFQATLKYDPNEAGFDRMKNYDRFIIKKNFLSIKNNLDFMKKNTQF